MSESATPWWAMAQGDQLQQGDLLPRCLVALFHPDFGNSQDATEAVEVREYDCVVMTQSCDLEHDKAPLVALCPVFSLAAYEAVEPRLAQHGEWEKVRQGRVEGLHMLGSPADPADNRASLVVDFRHIYSLPVGYLKGHARSLGTRWRLQSPFLEHLSQSFARFFMRVGLPASIPPFKK